jgi:hypothetical protein
MSNVVRQNVLRVKCELCFLLPHFSKFACIYSFFLNFTLINGLDFKGSLNTCIYIYLLFKTILDISSSFVKINYNKGLIKFSS